MNASNETKITMPTKCCPTCGQTLPPKLPAWGVNIVGVKHVLLTRIHKAGRHGISGPALFDLVYGSVKDPPAGGLNVISQMIIQTNRLIEAHGWRIKSSSRGGAGNHAIYTLVKL